MSFKSPVIWECLPPVWVVEPSFGTSCGIYWLTSAAVGSTNSGCSTGWGWGWGLGPGGYDTGLPAPSFVSPSATCSCHSAVNSSDFIYISQRPWNRKGATSSSERKRSQGPRWIKRFYLLRKLVAYPDRAPIILGASYSRCSTLSHLSTPKIHTSFYPPLLI